MPIYEYRCDNGHEFEVMQKMSDGPVATCQVCGAPVARVFHAPAVHFKGKGFYNTDYGTKRRNREQASNASSESKSGDAASTSSGDGSSSSSSDAKGTSTSSDAPAKKAS